MSNYTADQHLYFHYKARTITFMFKFENFNVVAIFCEFTDWFVSDLVRNTEGRLFL